MENNVSRGIHVTVLSQETGALMSTRTFDTHLHEESSKLLITFLNMTSPGRILCFAVKVMRLTNNIFREISRNRNDGSEVLVTLITQFFIDFEVF